MRKKLLCAALLAAGTACAHAAETTWTFSYQGLVDAQTGAPVNYPLTGAFRGEDLNADGIIVVDELTYFQADGYEFLKPEDSSDLNPGGCARTWNPYLKCEIDGFSYKTTGKLDFPVRRWGNDEASSSWGGQIVTGNYMSSYSGNWETGTYYSSRYNWTDETTLTISPPPVPEPSAALLLPAGLAVLVAARRRQRKVAK